MYYMKNLYTIILSNYKCLLHHVLSEIEGAKTVAPVEVLRISSLITIACEAS